MIAPLFLYDKDTPFPGLAALVPVLGCALVIYSTENERTRVAALLSWKPIVFIGLISYSLYLWHWPIFAFTTYELLRPLTFLEALLCVLVAVSAAVISWRFIERPFRRQGKRPSTVSSQPRWFFIPSIGRAGQFALVLTAVLIACGSFFQESKGRSLAITSRGSQLSWTSLEKIRAMRSKISRPAQTDRVRVRRRASMISSCGAILTRSITFRSSPQSMAAERHTSPVAVCQFKMRN